MVATGNSRAEYDRCTVKQAYKNVLSNVFKIT